MGEAPLITEYGFDQSLTVVYRVLFLLFAEAHALVPVWNELYRADYTIDDNAPSPDAIGENFQDRIEEKVFLTALGAIAAVVLGVPPVLPMLLGTILGMNRRHEGVHPRIGAADVVVPGPESVVELFEKLVS